ncbi:MAG: hypothetical protein CME59_07780 [Halioglobus sp.]|nr:hypothetical protein [Halioglobus sp.]|tara:strand:- start:1296 stop:1583 length:288 start_codon:yes stop_codon:yes gene_type:complete
MKCRLETKVVPGASRSEIVGWLGNSLKIRVAAAPEKGKANKAVIKLLSNRLGLNEDRISIVHGASSQRKVLEISGISEQQLLEVLPGEPGRRRAC